MEVVGALEVVRVLLVILRAFDLDCGVVEFVGRATHKVSHLSQSLEWLLRDDVSRHCVLASSQLPDMEVVYFDD